MGNRDIPLWGIRNSGSSVTRNSGGLQMISVLLVDDEAVLRDVGRLYMERSGDFIVTGTESGEKALDLLAEGRYDAVVADYEMPGINGIMLLRQVRELYGDLPFILFTGHGREDVAGDAVNIGADFYIQKGGDPRIQFTDIANKIEKTVERRRADVAVRISEQRLYDIVNFLPDATFVIDTEGKIIAWNQEIERITGIRAEDMIGKKNYSHSLPFYGTRRPMIIDLVLHPDPETERHYPSLHREGPLISAEGAIHLPDQTRFFLARSCILYDHHGKPAGAIESLRDITRIKNFEEKLVRIIRSLPVGLQVFRVQPAGSLTCLRANPVAEKITLTETGSSPGKKIEEIFPGTDTRDIPAECRRIAIQGGQQKIEQVELADKRYYDLSLFQIEPGEVAIVFMDTPEPA